MAKPLVCYNKRIYVSTIAVKTTILIAIELHVVYHCAGHSSAADEA